MINSPFLEAIVCMVFVFASLSALASLLHEIQSQYLDTRAVFLVKAIRRMLSDDKATSKLPGIVSEIRDFLKSGLKLFTFPISFPLMRHRKIAASNNKTAVAADGAPKAAADLSKDYALADAFFENSLIKYLGPEDSKKPSYISKETFVTALLDICDVRQYLQDAKYPELANLKNIPASVQEVMRTFIREAFHSPSAVAGPDGLPAARERKLRELLAKWYEETMDRATGWYKRDAGRSLFWWGLLIALFFYADSIRLFQYFMYNSTARQIVTAQAAGFDGLSPAYKEKLSGADTVKQPLDTLQARVSGLIKTEIKGLDTAHVFGWHFTKKTPPLDSAQYKATFDSLRVVAGKKYDPQILIKKTFDSLKSAWEYRAELRERMNGVNAGVAHDSATASTNTPKGNDPGVKNTDSLGILWKRQMSALESRAITDRQKVADAAGAAGLALKELETKWKAEKSHASGSWLTCIGEFFRKLKSGIVGILLTALAVSFGAPFWFDLLTTLVKLRGGGGGPRMTGVKPEEKKA
ncbi:MAG: hypothetical protein JF616_00150 [Fibrobacteres bacterium]|nr:hypothetical protein [Fibrobacterota bacterium]